MLAAQVPFGHVTMPVAQAHAEFVHTWPVPQALPHMPQLAALVARFTQLVPQAVWPLGQPQEPPLQTVLPLQALPHMPQFCWLVLRSTQSLPHMVWPPVQLPEQWLWLQSGVAPEHELAQVPQCR
jgi:hypothetical protein